MERAHTRFEAPRIWSFLSLELLRYVPFLGGVLFCTFQSHIPVPQSSAESSPVIRPTPVEGHICAQTRITYTALALREVTSVQLA